MPVRWFNTIFNGENLNGYSTSFSNLYTNRTFGATIMATNFSVVNNQQLQSGPGTNFLVSIYAYTAQTAAATDWQNQMSNLVTQVSTTDIGTARTNHYAWWDAFWNRSWIFVGGDANATNVTRGYLEHRFMDTCQGRGAYPIKFNGGTFTFDYNGKNGDYRAWGPGYWNQNTRLMYWPMLASGDFDMMLPFFNIYTNMLPVQTAATSKYYGHGGAFFPETFNPFGLYYLDDWGWNRTTATNTSNTYIKYHYQGGLETLAMMLSYYDYTQDSAFATNYIVPFATQAIRFFNDHWPRVGGKIKFYPANACEMYWSCTNSTDYISGLMNDITKLVALPTNLTTPALVNEWTNCYAALPPLPMDVTGTYVKPAQTYGSPNNSENPECYCIFPYQIFGIGRPNFNIGLATFNNRTIKTYKYDWSQDPMEEALVGLTSAAQTDVINNFNDTASGVRYQAFWATRNDYLPCEDTGGAAMSTLQYMLLQCVGSQIQLLPSWPSGWNVDCKLNAPSNTTVRLVLGNGAVTKLALTPAARTNDLVEPVPLAPTGLTAHGGNVQAALRWTGSTGASSYNIKRATVNGGSYTTIATNITALNFISTGLVNGTNYYFVVSASGLWGESSNSTAVSITPGLNYAVHFEGDLIVNVQSADLSSGTKVWSNRTSNAQSVGNFTNLAAGNLNMATVAWNGQPVKTLFVNSSGNNSMQSALASPAEIISNKPVSVEAWIYPTDVNQTSCYLGYGYQGGSGSPMNDREFDYDNGGHGVISGNFGNLDTGWSTVPTAGTWHYVAVTYDGTTLLAYLDGDLDVSRVIGVPIATVQTSMVVGSSIGGTGVNGGTDPFHGDIACVRVESGILTSNDIAANYAVGPLGTAAAITPTGLTATAGDGQVALAWNSSGNATNYYLKRSVISGGTYTVIATNLSMLSYTNTGLANGTNYYFVVSATNLAGESANSASVRAQPVSTTPPQLNVGVNSGSILQFTWPPDHQGWELQVQTNPLGDGLGTNWVVWPGSATTNQLTFPMNPVQGSVFFRLVYP